MTALFKSFSLMIIHDVFSLLILTYLQFIQVGKPVLDRHNMSPIHVSHLAVSPLTLLISLTNALFPDSIYKTVISCMYSICSNLNIDHCSDCLLNLVVTLNFQTLISELPEIL